MDSYIDIILYLGIYSFFGWICECVYCSVGNGQLTNRGFLYGPFCPIYGFGAVGVLYLLQWVPDTVSTIFIAGMVLTSTLEYFTSWAMEKIFSTSWWDYSNMKYNLNGRICLLNSTLFGILCVVLTFDIHPRVSALVGLRNTDFKLGFLFAFLIYIVADLSATLYSILGINIRLTKLEDMKAILEEKHAELGTQLSLVELHRRLLAMEIEDELTEKFGDLLKKNSFYQRRLIFAFPNMRNHRHPEYLRELKKAIEKRIRAK